MRRFLPILCVLVIAACQSTPTDPIEPPPTHESVTSSTNESAQQASETAMEIRVKPLETSWDKDAKRWILRVQVVFTNHTNDVFELDKVTACAGGQIGNNVFEVTAGGESIDYLGIMMKRAHPGPDGFFRLQPGQTHAEVVELGESYALPADGGVVSVRFNHFNHFSDNAVQLTSEPIDIKLTP